MISRCANPACTARFRYLHEGTVYRLASEVRCHDEWRCEGPHFHYFWLCESCAPKFRLVYTRTEGVYLEVVASGAHILLEPPASVQTDLGGEHAVVGLHPELKS